ncbi:MAG: hypothetical protein GY805_13460 [Chloroflexi bacterium]|nr:hypothetical protein [Chloroflexota bacterium]
MQVGIAYYQIKRDNFCGAVKMLMRVRQWLEPLPPVCRCRGIDIAKLREDAAQVQAIVTQLGLERIGEFDTAVFQPIHYL